MELQQDNNCFGALFDNCGRLRAEEEAGSFNAIFNIQLTVCNLLQYMAIHLHNWASPLKMYHWFALSTSRSTYSPSYWSEFRTFEYENNLCCRHSIWGNILFCMFNSMSSWGSLNSPWRWYARRRVAVLSCCTYCLSIGQYVSRDEHEDDSPLIFNEVEISYRITSLWLITLIYSFQWANCNYSRPLCANDALHC